MSVTYGFYNSLYGDRTYDARQFSSMFDSLIVDGIFSSIGSAMVVSAGEGLIVNVGSGRAWFNHTWTLNDSVLQLEASESDVLYNRIDAVVLEVNSDDLVRANSIKYITGTAASEPERPTLTNTENVHQYALAYISRSPNSTTITDSDITNMVGSDETPFVTGILQTVSIESLTGQWTDEINQYVANKTTELNEWSSSLTGEIDGWFDVEQADFLAWYNAMKGQLDEDPAGHLQNEIDLKDIKDCLLNGFVDGTKAISEDGLIILSIASDGRSLTKTFSSDFLSVTTVLRSASNADVAQSVKTFDPSGRLISTVVTIY